jgi:Nif-specific ferredoxin III
MKYVTGSTKSGKSWTPQYVESLDQVKCIGCGRCYNVCSHDVFTPEDVDVDEDNAGDYDDDVRMVMSIANDGNCIGCGACIKACSKHCFEHAPQRV